MASKSKNKPPTSSCVRYESHQQSEGTPTPQDAEIAPQRLAVATHHEADAVAGDLCGTDAVATRRSRRVDGVEGLMILSDAIHTKNQLELASTCADSALETHDLQIVHPTLGQHAVLEEDPVSTLDSFGY